MFVNKKKKLEQYAVPYIEGDPIWGVENIPAPTLEDIQWFEKTIKKSSNQMHYNFIDAAKEKKYWRFAALLNYSREKGFQNSFNPSHKQGGWSASEYVIDCFPYSHRFPYLKMLFDVAGPAVNAINHENRIRNLVVLKEDFKTFLLLSENNLFRDKVDLETHIEVYKKACGLGHQGYFSKIHLLPLKIRHHLLKKAVQEEDTETVRRMLQTGLSLQKSFKSVLSSRFSIKTLKAYADFGLDLKKMFRSCYADLSVEKIKKFHKCGVDIYFDNGAVFEHAKQTDQKRFKALCEYKYTEDQKIPVEDRVSFPAFEELIKSYVDEETGIFLSKPKPDAWEKITDTLISETCIQQDGSQLKTYFNFAARSVKTVLERDGKTFALFTENFSDVESHVDIKRAAKTLDDRKGDTCQYLKKVVSFPSHQKN